MLTYSSYLFKAYRGYGIGFANAGGVPRIGIVIARGDIGRGLAGG